MTRIVTTHYRYKPLPKKRKAAPLAGPAIVTPEREPTVAEKLEPAAAVVRKVKPRNDNRSEPEPEHLPNAKKKPAIVTARRPGTRFADVPDLTPEEHQQRVDDPLPSGVEALDEPFAAFPSWFLRIECDRCGKVSMLNEAHTTGRRREMSLRALLARMRHDGCGGLPGQAELLTGIEAMSSRVRKIVVRSGPSDR